MAENKASTNRILCAGNECSNEGIYPLTVLYLDREGLFCQSCKNELIRDGIAIEKKGIS